MPKQKYAEIPLTGKNGSGNFSPSLDNFKAEDIEPLTDRKFKKRSAGISGIIQYILIFVFAAVFIVCIYLLADNLIDKYKGGKIYNTAATLIEPVTITDTEGEAKDEPNIMTPYERLEALYGGKDPAAVESAYSMDLTSVKASLSALRQINSEVIGWIYVENTRINYPLMQSGPDTSREYYLTHAYTGEYLAVGSIYLAKECDSVLKNNSNSLIYGHNVANGTMFHDVLKFDDEEFFNNTLIYIYTLDGAYIYKPFSVYETTNDYNYIQTSFFNEGEFISFAERVKANSHIASGETVSAGDTIITLSTCTNGGVGTTGRWALHAKLIAFVE